MTESFSITKHSRFTKTDNTMPPIRSDAVSGLDDDRQHGYFVTGCADIARDQGRGSGTAMRQRRSKIAVRICYLQLMTDRVLL
jgi:hypothetical protein